MAQKIIQGDNNLAKKIKNRRNELGLTIEEAATRAGVGTKTWCRYESGGSIRKDKYRGVCKALNWLTFPDQEVENIDDINISEYKKHEAWSPYLEKNFGITSAFSFAVGSDLLLDFIKEDLNELSSMPNNSHIGQISNSFLSGVLPEQFLTHYDYNFLYQMKCVLCNMRIHAKSESTFVAHSILEELIIYLCSEEASIFVELSEEINDINNEWVFDLFGDMDIITFLYSNIYLDPEHPYHYNNWSSNQFYIDL